MCTDLIDIKGQVISIKNYYNTFKNSVRFFPNMLDLFYFSIACWFSQKKTASKTPNRLLLSESLPMPKLLTPLCKII